MITDQIRLFQLAMADTVQEYEFDFPILRTVKKGEVGAFISLAMLLPEEEARQLINLTVRKAHTQAVQTLGQTLSSSEFEILGGWDEYLDQYFHDYQVSLNRYRYHGKIKIDSSVVMTGVLNRLTVNLGGNVTQISPTNWHFITPLSGRFVQTGIQHLNDKVSYAQTVTDDDVPVERISERGVQSITSLPYWMGISNSGWDVRSEEETERIGNSMAACIERFLNFVRVYRL